MATGGLVAPNKLDDPSLPLVTDTSILINLDASKVLTEILTAIANPIVMVEHVGMELSNGPNRPALQALIQQGRIKKVDLEDEALAVFEDLVIGDAAETLDDGEAATIAIAVTQSAMALIDERKAKRICAERYPNLVIGHSIDIFKHQSVLHSLGKNGLTDAVFNALYFGKMRVPEKVDEQWVINLIGPERAAQCTCLRQSVRQS